MPRLFAGRVFRLAYNSTHNSLQAQLTKVYDAYLQHGGRNYAKVNARNWTELRHKRTKTVFRNASDFWRGILRWLRGVDERWVECRLATFQPRGGCHPPGRQTDRQTGASCRASCYSAAVDRDGSREARQRHVTAPVTDKSAQRGNQSSDLRKLFDVSESRCSMSNDANGDPVVRTEESSNEAAPNPNPNLSPLSEIFQRGSW